MAWDGGRRQAVEQELGWDRRSTAAKRSQIAQSTDHAGPMAPQSNYQRQMKGEWDGTGNQGVPARDSSSPLSAEQIKAASDKYKEKRAKKADRKVAKDGTDYSDMAGGKYF